MEKENKFTNSAIVVGELGVIDKGIILEFRTTDPILTVNMGEAKKLNEFLTEWIGEPEEEINIPESPTGYNPSDPGYAKYLHEELNKLRAEFDQHIKESIFKQL